MAAAFRIGMVRLSGLNSNSKLLSVQALLPTALTQKCTIMGRTMRGGPRIPQVPPYPYKEKGYNIIKSYWEKTTKRFDENTKVILVEGPIAAGKTAFAQELAEELDMLYVPPANMDLFYINSYGFDMRKLDDQLPESCRSFDVSNFLENPNHPLVAQLQIRLYQIRYEQYIDALVHILSTGQGVVLDRSCYSDIVFMEAMYKHGYISRGARSVYNEIRRYTLEELLRPHLVIYLDVPVDTVKKRIQERNIEPEVKSKVLTESYLRDMEILYKQNFLKEISTHAEILIYDWTLGTETEVVVEDIERLDFAQYELDPNTKKMIDWRLPLESLWTEVRLKYACHKSQLMNLFNVPRYDVPELVRDAEDGKKFRDVWYNAPGMKYRPGYNSDMGDTGLLTKIKMGVQEKI